MFEVELKDMTAVVTVESRVYSELTASNVGVNPELLAEGARVYTFDEAVVVVQAIDKAMRGCAKHFLNRFRAQRNSFIYAFGPEMESHINGASQ